MSQPESSSSSTKILPTNSFPNYTTVRKYHAGDTSCELVMVTLINNSLTFIRIPSNSLLPDDSTTEHFSITATISNIRVNIHNIDISPISSCPFDFTSNFHLLFNFHDDNITMGDFNAQTGTLRHVHLQSQGVP